MLLQVLVPAPSECGVVEGLQVSTDLAPSRQVYRSAECLQLGESGRLAGAEEPSAAAFWQPQKRVPYERLSKRNTRIIPAPHARTIGTSSNRVVHAGDRFPARNFHSRRKPCDAVTAVHFPYRPLISSSAAIRWPLFSP